MLWGVLAGLLLLATISPALTHLHVEAYWEKAIQGGIRYADRDQVSRFSRYNWGGDTSHDVLPHEDIRIGAVGDRSTGALA